MRYLDQLDYPTKYEFIAAIVRRGLLKKKKSELRVLVSELKHFFFLFIFFNINLINNSLFFYQIISMPLCTFFFFPILFIVTFSVLKYTPNLSIALQQSKCSCYIQLDAELKIFCAIYINLQDYSSVLGKLSEASLKFGLNPACVLKNQRQ